MIWIALKAIKEYLRQKQQELEEVMEMTEIIDGNGEQLEEAINELVKIWGTEDWGGRTGRCLDDLAIIIASKRKVERGALLQGGMLKDPSLGRHFVKLLDTRGRMQ